MAPKRFGKYEVLARLATGGAANIFLARQAGVANFQKLVCLKVLLPERASDADFVAMFLDEARLAARLNHPNCVQIFDLGRVRGSYYISMEYIFGETLWNLLATVSKLRTPLPASHVASIVASACDGLHHAHELRDSNGRPYNLVHRDVSPQNIMVTFEGQTKVLDFGIAKAETGRDPTMAGIVKGKFSYMSPEQITGASIDRRSDIYSLGIVLFECLASRRLYRGETPEEIARLILEHRAPRLRDVVPDVPPALDAICATALSRQPAKRYQTAHAMGEALRDYLETVRHAQTSAPIAKLIEERFKGQIAARRKVCEAALAGTQDDAQFLKALEARPAREVDLFPDEESPEASSDLDFDEPSGLIAAQPKLSSGADTIQGDEETGVIDHRSDVPVSVDSAPKEEKGRARPRLVSALTDPNVEEAAAQGATRIDPGDVGPAAMEHERVEATNIDFQIESNALADASLAGRRPSVVGSPLDVLPFSGPPPTRGAERAAEGGRSPEAGGKSRARSRDKESASDSSRPRGASDSGSSGKARERGRSPARAGSDIIPADLIESSSGLPVEDPEDESAATQHKAIIDQDLGVLDEETRQGAGSETEDLISMGTAPGGPPERKSPAPATVSKAEDVAEDAAEARTPSNFSIGPNGSHEATAAPDTTRRPIGGNTEPEVPVPGRFGLPAVLAALALGLALGLVFGLFLARRYYAPVPIPVVPPAAVEGAAPAAPATEPAP